MEGKKTKKLWLRVDTELEFMVRTVAQAKGWRIQDAARRCMAHGANHAMKELSQQIPGQFCPTPSNGV